MKFKVGDKVKFVKKIIFHNVEPGGIFRIIFISKNDSDVPYLAEELQKVEYTYKDLEKASIGTKVTFQNGEVLVKDDKDIFENSGYVRNILELDNFKSRILGKIIKIEEPEYLTVYESKSEILDEVEKRYLRNVIRPFRDKVKAISLITAGGKSDCYINIELEDETIYLPDFEINTMYKGMKLEKEYTLEELGL